jgi:DNA-directed RNA polymerase specialized sigma24 family protein
MIDAYRRLRRLLQRMGTKVREVFVRVTMEGQTVKEVAEELHTSPKTVHSRMRVGRQAVIRIN